MKRQPKERKKIFLNHVCDKGLISRMGWFQPMDSDAESESFSVMEPHELNPASDAIS